MRAIEWLCFYGAMAAMFWLGFIEGLTGAQNVLIFFVWAMLLLTMGCMREKAASEIRKKGRSVPAAVSGTYDLVLIAGLVWFGAWWAASAFAVCSLLQWAIYEGGKKQEAA